LGGRTPCSAPGFDGLSLKALQRVVRAIRQSRDEWRGTMTSNVARMRRLPRALIGGNGNTPTIMIGEEADMMTADLRIVDRNVFAFSRARRSSPFCQVRPGLLRSR